MTVAMEAPIEAEAAAPPRVLLVDDHRVLRDSLSRSLVALGLSVVGEAATGTEALRAAAETRPDVVVMDVSLPDIDGLAIVRRLRSEHPEIRVVMLTMFADKATVRDAFNAGAVAYLTKDCSITEIVEVLESASKGGATVHGMNRHDAAATGSEVPPLSRREVEVLQLVAEGKATVAVARELFISVKTVKNHLANIYEKLDVCDRTQAVVQGLRLGLVNLR